MFYVRIENDDIDLKVGITDENVFTRCPVCGKEKQVDLADIFRDGGDLLGTSVYCSDCFKLMND